MNADNFFDDLFNSMSPAQKRNHNRHMFVLHTEMKMRRVLRWPTMPVLNLVWIFWTCIMEEGIVSTCKPRWGALTFAFLNDGMKPTLYHTVLGLLNKNNMLYPEGAPRNSREV